MSEPDFIVCNECDSPVYVFEWKEGRISEALCTSCGNSSPSLFTTEEDYGDEMASGAHYYGEGDS